MAEPTVYTFAPGVEPAPPEQKNDSRWFQSPKTYVAPHDEGVVTFAPGRDISQSEDLKNTIKNQMSYVPGSPLGYVGSMGEMVDVGKANLFSLPALASEKLGYSAPGTYENLKKEFYKDYGVGTGVNNILGVNVPTVGGMEALTNKVLGQTEYEPEYKQNKLIGAGLRMAGEAAETGGLGAIGETVNALSKGEPIINAVTQFGKETGKAGSKGLVSGVASEGAAQSVDALGYKELEPYARFAGAVTGGAVHDVIGATIKSVAESSKVGQDKITAALAKDIKSGQANITPEDYQKLLARGISPTLWEIGGPNTRALIKSMGYSEETMAALNQKFIDAQKNSGKGVVNLLEGPQGFKTKLDAPAMKSAIEDIQGQEVSRLYKLAESSPKAQAVDSPELRDLMTNNKYVKDAMGKVNEIATDPELKIKRPQWSQPEQAPTGTVMGPDGKPIVTPRAEPVLSPANITYWDNVKRQLDIAIENSKSPTEQKLLNDTRVRLLKALDDKVDGYADARGAHFEKVGAKNSIELGQKSGLNLNADESFNFKKAYSKLTDEDKANLAYGQGFFLKNLAENQGADGVLKWADDNRLGVERFKIGMGEEKVNKIIDEARLQSLTAKVAQLPNSGIKERGISEGTITSALAGLVGGEAAAVIGGMVMNGQLNTSTQVMAAIGTAIVGAATKGTYNFAQKRVAETVSKLALSGDPADTAKLMEMARTNYPVRSLLEGAADNLLKAGLVNVRANPEPPTDRPGRKAGGRVEEMSDKIVRQLTRNRNLISNNTESMLSMPDDAIVQALDQAKAKII